MERFDQHHRRKFYEALGEFAFQAASRQISGILTRRESRQELERQLRTVLRIAQAAEEPDTNAPKRIAFLLQQTHLSMEQAILEQLAQRLSPEAHQELVSHLELPAQEAPDEPAPTDTIPTDPAGYLHRACAEIHITDTETIQGMTTDARVLDVFEQIRREKHLRRTLPFLCGGPGEAVTLGWLVHRLGDGDRAEVEAAEICRVVGQDYEQLLRKVRSIKQYVSRCGLTVGLSRKKQDQPMTVWISRRAPVSSGSTGALQAALPPSALTMEEDCRLKIWRKMQAATTWSPPPTARAELERLIFRHWYHPKIKKIRGNQADIAALCWLLAHLGSAESCTTTRTAMLGELQCSHHTLSTALHHLQTFLLRQTGYELTLVNPTKREYVFRRIAQDELTKPNPPEAE